jgi:plastocyanin
MDPGPFGKKVMRPVAHTTTTGVYPGNGLLVASKTSGGFDMARPATTMRRLVGPLLLVTAVAIIAAACNGTGPTAYGAPASTAATTTAATAPNAATIKGFSFQPDVLKVKVGAKVTWTNDDTVVHTVTADTNSFASGNLQPAGSFSFTFTRPGTYAYHCSIHPSMHGSVVVG